MHLLVAFIVLSSFGIIDAGYLAYAHRRSRPLVCPLNHDCSAVTESGWARTFGVRNELLGLLFYLAAFGIAAYAAVSPSLLPFIKTVLVPLTGAGLSFSLFLTALQIFAVKNYCFYCLLSALITLLLFVNSIIL